MIETMSDDPCLQRDSNALILPVSRGGKAKRKIQERAPVKNSKLSKSHKRKLQKIEEEKERARLLNESIETLEKYKIPDDSLSLLRSSRNLSRIETQKEKRRLAVQYSIAGLEISHDARTSGMNVCISVADGKLSSDFPNDFQPEELLFSSCASLPHSSMDKNVVFNAKVTLNNDIGSTFESPPAITSERSLDLCNKPSTTVSCTEKSKLMVHQTTPFVVQVSRPLDVDKDRRELPIVGMEQEIMEAVNSEGQSVVIICGETGCGKTTQVPQFLYEAGFGSSQCLSRSGMIGITQPRRVAVLTTAKRVAYELGLQLGKEVGFQVRYDKKIGDCCSIKFMTDGILLREVQNDILLKQYSFIILDEAHERSVNTDILVGMLSRVVKLRQKKFEEQLEQNVSPENMIFPLKVILMSATLRIEDFVSRRTLYREIPPVINVEGRQYNVVKHYSRRTETVDYIGEAYKKAMSIHKRLPPGGILIFVTGQREVEFLCKKLKKDAVKLLTRNVEKNGPNVSLSTEISSVNGISMEVIDGCFARDTYKDKDNDLLHFADNPDSDESYSEGSDDFESESDEASLIDDECDHVEDLSWKEKDSYSDSNLLVEEETFSSLKAAFEALADNSGSNSKGMENSFLVPPSDISDTKEALLKMHVLPLYAMLPAREQLRVYEQIQEGERLVVVATNVAETSLTIPGIRYVVDTGREKVKKYNQASGMESYDIQWISKASADQRAGRAGRTGPGHCYRLYSRAVYENIFPQFSCPEISKVPVDSIVLVLKSMGIAKVENFPFPTPPESAALLEAERCLKTLDALDSNGRLTPLGKVMAHYPMNPRHSRMILTAIQICRTAKTCSRPNAVIGYAIAASVALSHPSPFQMQHVRTNAEGPDGDGEDSARVFDDVHRIDEQRRKHKERTKASRDRFSNPNSDALTAAFALQCFEQSPNRSKFCSEYALQLKIMEEMSRLRKQILHTMFQQNFQNCSDQSFSWVYGSIADVEREWSTSSDKYPLLLNEECIIRQAICSGWVDKVARKLKVQKKANAVAYEAYNVKEHVFLHHSSSLFKTAPEFLTYSELLRTKRPYLHGATMVRPEWLAKFSSNLLWFSLNEKQKLDDVPHL